MPDLREPFPGDDGLQHATNRCEQSAQPFGQSTLVRQPARARRIAFSSSVLFSQPASRSAPRPGVAGRRARLLTRAAGHAGDVQSSPAAPVLKLATNGGRTRNAAPRSHIRRTRYADASSVAGACDWRARSCRRHRPQPVPWRGLLHERCVSFIRAVMAISRSSNGVPGSAARTSPDATRTCSTSSRVALKFEQSWHGGGRDTDAGETDLACCGKRAG